MPAYSYVHLDVFTGEPFTGNQLAVFPDASGLAVAQMQRIAAEMAFSETTFVLPPATPGTDARVRIFTPQRELPMAGHPTIGTTFALVHRQRIAAGKEFLTLGLGIGPVSVQMEWRGSDLHFAWMKQPVPDFGATPGDRPALAAALGVSEADLASGPLSAQIVSSGVPFLFVPLATRKAVDAAALDRALWQRYCMSLGDAELPVFLFSLEPGADGATAYSRMFAPVFGIAEDPATGGASGPLGGYLVHHGAVDQEAARRMLSLQGVKMGRPSRIHIDVESAARRIKDVRVGGQSVLVAEGALYV